MVSAHTRTHTPPEVKWFLYAQVAGGKDSVGALESTIWRAQLEGVQWTEHVQVADREIRQRQAVTRVHV